MASRPEPTDAQVIGLAGCLMEAHSDLYPSHEAARCAVWECHRVLAEHGPEPDKGLVRGSW